MTAQSQLSQIFWPADYIYIIYNDMKLVNSADPTIVFFIVALSDCTNQRR